MSPRRVIPPDSPPPESLEDVLLLLGKENLSAAQKWYVRQLSKVFSEITRAPKVKVDILRELRDFIIPTEDRVSQKELFDPAVDPLVGGRITKIVDSEGGESYQMIHDIETRGVG